MSRAAPSAQSLTGKQKERGKLRRTCYRREEDPAKALLAYRSTPLQGGKTPSELLFGRQIRCTLPCIPAALQPSWLGIEEWRQEESERKIKQKQNYDLRHRVKELVPFQPGERVWIHDENTPATVKNRAQANKPRSYLVEASGSILRRNWSALQPYADESLSSDEKPSTSDDKPFHQEDRPAVPEPAVIPEDSVMRTHSGRLIKPPQRLDL